MNIEKEDFEFLVKMAISGIDEVCGRENFERHQKKLDNILKKYE